MSRRMAGKTCGHCGYELTGLEAEGRCPECGGYYDSWSGEGVGGGPMESVRRGDWVVRLMQSIGLFILALAIMGLGSLFSWRSGDKTPVIFGGVIAVIFLAMSVTIAVSLKKK